MVQWRCCRSRDQSESKLYCMAYFVNWIYLHRISEKILIYSVFKIFACCHSVPLKRLLKQHITQHKKNLKTMEITNAEESENLWVVGCTQKLQVRTRHSMWGLQGISSLCNYQAGADLKVEQRIPYCSVSECLSFAVSCHMVHLF